jgi:hypothetical protein
MDQGFNIPFKLEGIHTMQFAQFEKTEIDTSNLTIETSLSFSLDIDQNTVSVASKFSFETLGKPLILIQMGCNFLFEKESMKNFYTSDNEVVIPKDLMGHLSVITVGTTRGALHAKTEGSSLNRYFIPTINVTELIPEDVRFYRDSDTFISE